MLKTKSPPDIVSYMFLHFYFQLFYQLVKLYSVKSIFVARCLNKIEICKQPTVKPWLNHDSPILKLFKYFFLCGRKLIFVFFFYLYLYSKELSFYLQKVCYWVLFFSYFYQNETIYF